VGVAVRAVGDRVELGRLQGPRRGVGTILAVRALRGLAEAGAAQRLGDAVLEAPVVRGVGHGELDAAHRARRLLQVGAVQRPVAGVLVHDLEAGRALAHRRAEHRQPGAVDHDHVTGVQPGQRRRDAVRRRGAAAAGGLGLGPQTAVVLHVAPLAAGLAAQALEALALALDPRLEADDGAVGLELRERQVEEVVGLFGPVAADEVGRHVVRRPEGRAERVGAARRERGHLLEGHEG
jgi:hypothetical protein